MCACIHLLCFGAPTTKLFKSHLHRSVINTVLMDPTINNSLLPPGRSEKYPRTLNTPQSSIKPSIMSLRDWSSECLCFSGLEWNKTSWFWCEIFKNKSSTYIINFFWFYLSKEAQSDSSWLVQGVILSATRPKGRVRGRQGQYSTQVLDIRIS